MSICSHVSVYSKTMKTYNALNHTGSHRQKRETKPSTFHGAVAAAGFALAYITLAAVVVASSLRHPSHTNQGDQWACARSSRHENYATVNVAIGTPPRVFKLLLELDSLDEKMVIENDELLASSSLSCNPDTRMCEDLAILDVDARSQTVALEPFKFSEPSSTTSMLQLDGSFSLSSNTEYELTSTHLCFRPTTTDDTNDDDTNTIHATVSPKTSKLVFQTAKCGEGDLFPTSASHERSWLALATTFLFEASVGTLEERRNAVSDGLNCANGTAAQLYQLDCKLDQYSTCRYRPSLSYRTISTSDVKISTTTSNATIRSTKNNSLINSLDNADLATGSLRFVILLLIAFVVYSRSERQSSSAVFTLLHAKKVLNSLEVHHHSHTMGVVGDALVGLLSIVCRLVVVVAKAGNLMADNATDCVVSEVIGISVSVIHFLLRNVVLEFRGVHFEAPLTKLGGSMALSDAGAAALASVASSPLAASSLSFDSTARLFSATFLLVYVFHRLLCSAAACALMSSTTSSSTEFERKYSLTLGFSYFLWILQLASVGYAFGRFFVAPFTFSLLRASTTQSQAIVSLVICVCSCINGLSLHRVLLRLRRAAARSPV